MSSLALRRIFTTMTIATNSRLRWFGTAILLVFLWSLFHSDVYPHRRSLPAIYVPEQHSPSALSDDPSFVPEVRREPSEYKPGDTIPPSAWQELVSSDPANLESNNNINQNNGHYDMDNFHDQGDLLQRVSPESCAKFGFQSPETLRMIQDTKRVTATEDRPLILYAFFQTDDALMNLQFFVNHGLHGGADFIFILNGETNVDETVIFKQQFDKRGFKRDMSNIFVKKRDNRCYDLGAHAEVLGSIVGGEGWFNIDGPIPLPAGAQMPEKKPEPEKKEKENSSEQTNAVKEQELAMEGMSDEEKEAERHRQAQLEKDLQEEMEAEEIRAEGERQRAAERKAKEAESGREAAGRKQKRTHDRSEKQNNEDHGRNDDRLSSPKRSTVHSTSEFALTPLRYRYKRYILMNASIRGPFPPPWTSQCWSDAYLNRVTSRIKLVGMSYNCFWGRGHVQSMIWATDRTGLEVILEPSGIGECFPGWFAATEGEIRTTKLVRDHGYEVDAFLTVYHSSDQKTRTEKAAARRLRLETKAKVEKAKEDEQHREKGTSEDDSAPKEEESKVVEEEVRKEKEEQEKERKEKDAEEEANSDEPEVPGDFWKDCINTGEFTVRPGAYFGTNVHPYENLFVKVSRHVDDTTLDRLTQWHDGAGWHSWDFCR